MIKRIFLGLLLVFVLPMNVIAFENYEQYYRNSNINFYDPTSLSCSFASGGGGSLTVDPNLNLGEEGQERRVRLMELLINDYALTPEQASGILGNFMKESALDLPPNINQGGELGPPKFDGGYGWAQWTGGRQVQFIDYSIANGYMNSRNVSATDAANYVYFKYELSTGTYSNVIEGLKEAQTSRDAAYIFEDLYEDAGTPDMPKRVQYAQQALDEYLASSDTVTSSDTYCRNGQAVVFGEYAFPLVTTKSDINNSSIFVDGDTNQGHPYEAYDIYVEDRTEVVSFISGRVVSTGTDKCGSRIVGVYNEENDIVVTHMHMLSEELPSLGDEVAAGETIGLIADVETYPCVNVDHLHIDAYPGDDRPGCRRENCPAAENFLSIGEELFEGFILLPD